MLDIEAEVREAGKRISNLVRRTPVEESRWLGRTAGCSVSLKLENLQISSSFKLRGAANKLLSLGEDERRKGVVAASTGNHGAAVAHLLTRFGWPGVIYLPETASPSKIRALEEQEVELVLVGSDGIDAERIARTEAERSGRIFLSPYNDVKVIGGQGTIGLELEDQIERIDTVLIPVGGGGLAAGVGGYLKAIDDSIEIIGCQPLASRVMYESIQAGEVLELESSPTLADGTAGGVEADSVTLPLCQEVIDDFLLVDEGEILAAIRHMLTRHHLLIEGAAALPIAALLQSARRFAGKSVVLILTGARLSMNALARVVSAEG
ncbi:MAG: threonine/serine dehydratase [Acidobacteriota bacterium]